MNPNNRNPEGSAFDGTDRGGARPSFISDVVPGSQPTTQPGTAVPGAPVLQGASTPAVPAGHRVGQPRTNGGNPHQPIVAPEPTEQHTPVVYDDLRSADMTAAKPATTTADQPVSNSAPATDSGKGGKKHHQGLRDFASVLGVIASALVLALGLIAFVFQSYQVDGPSMQTTLENSDHLIVWKVPRTIARITHHTYIPNRGDIIVFTEPKIKEFGQDPNKQLIKRVIGLPGDHVVVKDGVITIYNSEHPDGFNPDKTLPYGNVIVTTPGNVDVTIQPGEVFACGDHRTNSLDSRSFGPVDANNIVGKLVVRVLPLDTFKKF